MKRLNQTVSDYCDFVCSLFPKAILFYFYSYVAFVLSFLLISSSFDGLGRLCFMTVAFPYCLYLHIFAVAMLRN